MRLGRSRPSIPEWVPKHAGIVFLSNHREAHTYDDGVHVIDAPVRGYVHPCKSIHRNPLDSKYRDELLAKLGMRYWSHVTGQDMPTMAQIESVA